MEPAAGPQLANPVGLVVRRSIIHEDAWPVIRTRSGLSAVGNAFYFAAWVGLLVTALNLIPSGQLDGGHAIYAVFGEKVHYWTGRIAFAVMALLSVSGMYFLTAPAVF